MLDFLRCWSNSLLGIDIRDHEVRIMQLQGIKERRRISLASSVILPAGAVVEGHVHDVELLTGCLQDIVLNRHLQEQKVALAIPDSWAVTKSISVIKGLPEHELEAEVVSHLSQCFPGVVEGLCYDYVIGKAKEEMLTEVVLVATTFAQLNAYVAAVQNAGLKVVIVDVNNYAITRAKEFIEKTGLLIEEKWLVSCGLALRGSGLW